MHIVVDHADCVQFVRSYDETRIPATLRYPAVQGANFLEAVPQVHREGIAIVLRRVRETMQPHAWPFKSVLIPGELRVLHARPAPGQPGSLTISVLRVASESDRDNRESDTAQAGGS